jgi:periplasmic glucans biosynthesis protein
MAQAIAAERHVSTAPVLPKELRDLNYDQHRAIRWKDEYMLWRREGLPFQCALFSPGLHLRPAGLNFYEVANSAFERLRLAETRFAGGFLIRSVMPDFAFSKLRLDSGS